MDDRGKKRIKLLPEMEGSQARWYARVRGTASQLATYRAEAARLTAGLPAGAAVLEVAPGPGYHAVEMARLGDYSVTGLDVARTFVKMAGEYARREGVTVDFRHGDVAAMPFAPESFDLIVCQAAFKNFTRPDDALAEMHRVLRPGGRAIIQDLRRDATAADIRREVEGMRLSRANSIATRFALRMLRRRAYSWAQFEALVARSPFGSGDVSVDGVGLEVRLTK